MCDLRQITLRAVLVAFKKEISFERKGNVNKISSERNLKVAYISFERNAFGITFRLNIFMECNERLILLPMKGTKLWI